MPAVQSPHLVIPFASCSGEAWPQAMQALPPATLKNLGKLLQGMKLVETDTGEAHSLSTPHERVLAKALGLASAGPLADGLIPWAAWEAKAGTDTAWTIITPCHWAMGREHATLTDPAALALTAEESRTLLAAMQPYFETEGITLHYAAPERWLAEGEVFRHLPTASLDRVLGRNVDAWLPGAKTGDGRRAGPPQASPAPCTDERGSVPPKAREATSVGARTLRRLQNEMQMLLYTHALNDARSSKRLQPVNSFWFSGSGALTQTSLAPAPNVTVPRTLAQAAFTDDWSAYAQAWSRLDAGDIARLLALQNSGQRVRLTLCGESHARTFDTAPRGLMASIARLLSPPHPLELLRQL